MPDRKTNVVTWVVDGKQYPVDLFDIDGLEWRDIKRQTGLKQYEVVTAALDDHDFEAIASLIWTVRKRDDPTLPYETVLKMMHYGDRLDGDTEVESVPPV